jgi:hypothetical protein
VTAARASTAGVDVIIGVDVMSGHEFLVYGRKTVERISRMDSEEEFSVLYIGLDQETEELERLVALVEVVKGSHDYRSYGEGEGR